MNNNDISMVTLVNTYLLACDSIVPVISRWTQKPFGNGQILSTLNGNGHVYMVPSRPNTSTEVDCKTEMYLLMTAEMKKTNKAT